MLFWIMIGALVLLLALRLWLGPSPTRHADSLPPTGPLPDAAQDDELWTVDALQKYGTPDTAADLYEQGRADELRGLGYRGEISEED
ncbi:hypothetical protein [Croceicoccus sp. Ery15]|uniref:hypothetical protein n=1 Tax=Croceicoccus sp. Ery15 TaxID=1703338 RepID=UPI001E293510|nr:hypothetical protein [Croceicoccus sp. Ery15]